MGAELTLFVGTFSKRGALGIYTCRMDVATGALEQVGVTGGIMEPSFLALDSSGEYLYAVSEMADAQGEGGVYAYAIAADGALTFLNRVSTGGPGPCHLAIDGADSYIVATNYNGGSVCLLPIGADGHLQKRSDFVQHAGSSVNPARQGEAHAHSVTFDRTNQWAYVCDLGMDQVLAYRIDGKTRKLALDPALTVHAEPGQGPRHFDFSPSQEHCYVLNELGSTVAVYDRDVASGRLTARQLISTLPDSWEGESHTADVHVSGNGRFLYASNRGHDSIAIFAIEPATGELSPVGHEPTGGENPRNFALTPDGQFLLAENSVSGTIVTFAVDADSGGLEPTGDVLELPAPVCIKFRP
jgi:6-phosphogluconolactonase